MTASSDSSTDAAARRGRSRPRRHLGFLLLFLAGTGACVLGLQQLRARFVFESFRVAAAPAIPVERVRLAGHDSPPVHFLLLHGYGANRRQLIHLAEVLATTGAEVYVPDLPGRGDHPGTLSQRPPEGPGPTLPTPRETQAASAVVQALEGRFGVRPERLVVVGHSLGGGVALEIARRYRPVATVSLAGLERPVAPGEPPNLLLVTARVEIPSLRGAADRMYERARSGRAVAGDEMDRFLEGRAVGREEFAATHASLPFHSSVQQAIVEWTNRALPGARLTLPPYFNEALLAWEFSGLFFLAGLFVPLAGLAGWVHEPVGEEVPETRLASWSRVRLASYALLAGAAGVSSLRLLAWFGWPHPLSFLHLADGDYLASLLLFSTVWLLPTLRRRPHLEVWRGMASRTGVAAVLAAYVILAGGGFITWQLFDLSPTPTRLAKMLLLAAVLFPYGLGEERLLRSVGCPQRRASPLVAFLVWRLALLVGIIYGAVALSSGEGLLVVMGVPLVLLSLVEYFFSATLYRSLRSVYANAVLKAVLLGWIIATVFPLR